MKVYNIIPPEYKGNPRAALGYAWEKYIPMRSTWSEEERAASPWGGYEAAPQSIPGEDVVGGVEKLRELTAQMEAMGLICAEDKAPVDAHAVAFINCMWCGGGADYCL